MGKRQTIIIFRIKILFVLILFLLSGCITISKAPKPQPKKKVLDDVLVFRDLQQVDLDNDGKKDIVAIYATADNSTGVKVIKFYDGEGKGDIIFEHIFNTPNVKYIKKDNNISLTVEEIIPSTGSKLKNIYRWDGRAFVPAGK